MKSKHQTGGKVIVSSYLSGATPSKEDLRHLVASMQATEADIIKVVSNANDITELERIFHLLSHSEVRYIMVKLYAFKVYRNGKMFRLYEIKESRFGMHRSIVYE